ncbi:MerC domain-containing protein [Winogradskyella sp.]|jgi:hypothetical protein|uniref:MerC domain-containing protein n=1 Tax=Winogradskyella sp. TaxID=1883156 RepID=UPI0025D65AD1|nr:MerC domain-containing protein [Winogradskyella sp.]MCT4630966.1 MerC domain-containing protein [Winogradskyella sp.]
MVTKILKQTHSDAIGAFASGLCLIHCIATPFLFIAQTCSATCCDTAPIWWSMIDYLFIGISFFAVYWSAKNSSKKWINYTLWLSWLTLCLVILNEKLELITLPESSIYLPAIALVIMHLYNRKHCKCKNDKCCASIS